MKTIKAKKYLDFFCLCERGFLATLRPLARMATDIVGLYLELFVLTKWVKSWLQIGRYRLIGENSKKRKILAAQGLEKVSIWKIGRGCQ